MAEETWTVQEPGAPIRLETVQQLTPRQCHRFGYGRTAYNMQKTGFHQWGFVIYRCDYSDDGLWERYLDFLRSESIESLTHLGSADFLGQYLKWTVVEDRETLKGASKDDIRKRFEEWAKPRAVLPASRGPVFPFVERQPANPEHRRRLPRFEFCLYVDSKCLHTMAEREEHLRLQRPKPTPEAVVVIIDANVGPEGDLEDGYPEVEGCTRKYLGWIYCEFHCVLSFYDELHYDEIYHHDGGYARPPQVYPSFLYENKLMPL